MTFLGRGNKDILSLVRTTFFFSSRTKLLYSSHISSRISIKKETKGLINYVSETFFPFLYTS